MERDLETASHVVVGEVSYGTFAGTSYSFTLVVDRSLKGDSKPGEAIPVGYDAKGLMVGGKGEFRGEFGLWLLVKDNHGRWLMRPPGGRVLPFQFAYYPLPKAPQAKSTVSRDVTLLDAVFLELASAAEAEVEGQTFRWLAEGVLRSVGPPVGQEVRWTLERWSHSSTPNLIALGFTGLVTLEDVDAVVRSRTALRVIAESQIARQFSGAVSEYRNPSPVGMGALGEMATEVSEIPGLQRDAAHALRSIHTSEALP
jgi:hypothetical protein